jgi:hypothetical protein
VAVAVVSVISILSPSSYAMSYTWLELIMFFVQDTNVLLAANSQGVVKVR